MSESYKNEPFNALETDPNFIEKLQAILPALDHEQKIDLRWIINRAYFTGYQNGGTDGD